jgi:endonuclease/exonuclease/phosphatase family metal-dependent hydrolase
LRIVSANLWNGNADPAAFADLVAALQADVVAVQELSEEQAEALAAVLPHGLLEPANDYLGMGIALRRPGTVRRLRMPYRDARIAEVQPAGAKNGDDPVEILNVHVRAPHSMVVGWSWISRRGQLRVLERHLDASPARRRVLVGDLNATPIWPVYRRLSSRLSDAAVAAAAQNSHRPQPTWGPFAWAPRMLRIDHVLVNGLIVNDCRVVRVAGADHSAVVADLALPSPTP